jgi:putative transposase
LNSSPEVILLAVLMYVRFPLSLRNGEDLLFERGFVDSENIMRLPHRHSFGTARTASA